MESSSLAQPHVRQKRERQEPPTPRLGGIAPLEVPFGTLEETLSFGNEDSLHCPAIIDRDISFSNRAHLPVFVCRGLFPNRHLIPCPFTLLQAQNATHICNMLFARMYSSTLLLCSGRIRCEGIFFNHREARDA